MKLTCTFCDCDEYRNSYDDETTLCDCNCELDEHEEAEPNENVKTGNE